MVQRLTFSVYRLGLSVQRLRVKRLAFVRLTFSVCHEKLAIRAVLYNFCFKTSILLRNGGVNLKSHYLWVTNLLIIASLKLNKPWDKEDSIGRFFCGCCQSKHSQEVRCVVWHVHFSRACRCILSRPSNAKDTVACGSNNVSKCYMVLHSS